MALGLYTDNDLVGVGVIGKPASYTLCNAMCGKDESKNVGEFNRLWVSDEMPRNTESWFMARILRASPYDILVSFADTAVGHVGYIYQATNWLYTGLSLAQKYYRVKTDGTSSPEQYRRRARRTKKDIVRIYGENMVEEYWSSTKHRYVYFTRRRRELLQRLQYPILPYPK